MKRVLVGVVVAMLGIGLSAQSVQAEKKQRASAQKKSKKQEAVPSSEQIAPALGDLKWGMSKDELTAKFLDKIRDKYRPLIAKTKDAIGEDRLRQEARAEADAIKKGYVEFDGRSTGWNVSFLKGEFTHNNGEGMLVVRDGNSQNFYFFIGGKFWKWYKAFDASVFPAGDFSAFATGVQRRFGPAKDAEGELRQGEGHRHWLEWQDKQSRLRAVDLSDFYGFYSLVFEEKQTVDNLARLRTHKEESNDKRNAMIEAVTSERSNGSEDDSANIVDRITGRIRNKEQAQETRDTVQTASTKKGKDKGKAKEDEEPEESRDDDDPISGLGL